VSNLAAVASDAVALLSALDAVVSSAASLASWSLIVLRADAGDTSGLTPAGSAAMARAMETTSGPLYDTWMDPLSSLGRILRQIGVSRAEFEDWYRKNG
jgi:hypothetical protein